MTATADVSVIVPAYNAAETLPRALKTVADQTLPPREVVVVDDGSGDGTYDIALGLVDGMKPVDLKVFRQENQGAGAARNRAVAEASSTYVAFLDADDEWFPEKLERVMPWLTEKGFSFLSHDLEVMENGKSHIRHPSRHYQEAGDHFHALFRRGFISTATTVARREAVLKVGGFDVTLPAVQDFDLWLGIVGLPETRFVVIPEVLTRYHILPGSISSKVDRRLRCGLLTIKKHCGTLKSRPAPPGSGLASLWFRILAIHAETLAAHRAQGSPLRALFSLIKIPWNLVSLTLFYGLANKP